MKLQQIKIWWDTFNADEFWSNNFLTAINRVLNSWTFSSKIGVWIWVITWYSPDQNLEMSEIVEVARAITWLKARAITLWEIDSSSVAELSPDDKLDVVTFNKSNQEVSDNVNMLVEDIQEDDSEITLMTTIGNTSYWIFKSESNWNSTFYITDKKKNGTAGWYVVDVNGESLSELPKNQKVYCLIQVGTKVEIWSGSRQVGFEHNTTIKNIEAESIDVLYEDIIAVVDEGIYTLKNIETNEDLLNIPMKEFSGFTDSWKPVDIYYKHWKYLFIYKWFNDNWDISYIATDDDLDDECYSSKYPIFPIITHSDTYLTMYSPRANLYALTSMSEILVGTIVAYVDEDENHYIGWNFPEYVTNPQWISQLRFIYYRENEAWEKEYDTWYVFSGIESDTIPTWKDEDKKIDLLQIPVANSIEI